eukprot:569852-Pelagomonas_calceolata.AAC.1
MQQPVPGWAAERSSIRMQAYVSICENCCASRACAHPVMGVAGVIPGATCTTTRASSFSREGG